LYFAFELVNASTNTRSPSCTVYPSIASTVPVVESVRVAPIPKPPEVSVVPSVYVAPVIAVLVVSANISTESCTFKPCVAASTYALFAASDDIVGVATLVIRLLATSTVPVPCGTKSILVFDPPAVNVKVPVPVILPFVVPVPPYATPNAFVKFNVAIVAVPLNVGLALNTKLPVPVAPVEVTPSIVGCPVNVGALILGLVANTKLPVPVAPVEVTPSIVGCPVIVGAALNTKLPVPVAPVEVTPSIVGCPVNVGALANT